MNALQYCMKTFTHQQIVDLTLEVRRLQALVVENNRLLAEFSLYRDPTPVPGTVTPKRTWREAIRVRKNKFGLFAVTSPTGKYHFSSSGWIDVDVAYVAGYNDFCAATRAMMACSRSNCVPPDWVE